MSMLSRSSSPADTALEPASRPSTFSAGAGGWERPGGALGGGRGGGGPGKSGSLGRGGGGGGEIAKEAAENAQGGGASSRRPRYQAAPAMKAEQGIVRIQAQSRLPATPQRTADTDCAAPTPTMEPVM